MSTGESEDQNRYQMSHKVNVKGDCEVGDMDAEELNSDPLEETPAI
jgi:cytochrome oxidase Cu insertion factor (SCO1/SenC/PrrC family)